MKWSDRLEQKRREKGWSKRELSRRADIPYDNLTKYLTGDVAQPRGDILQKLADAIGVHLRWLRDGEGPELNRIPVVGIIGAGEEWIPIDDHLQGAGIDEIDFSLDDADPIGPRLLPWRRGWRLLASDQGSPGDCASASRTALVLSSRPVVALSQQRATVLRTLLAAHGPPSRQRRAALLLSHVPVLFAMEINSIFLLTPSSYWNLIPYVGSG